MKRHLSVIGALAALAVLLPATASSAGTIDGRTNPLCDGFSGKVVCVIR